LFDEPKWIDRGERARIAPCKLKNTSAKQDDTQGEAHHTNKVAGPG